MFPILLSIGSLNIYSLSVMIILAWLVFSFLFWQQLRQDGIEEERIFDLTFYATIAAFFAARVVFVVFHWGFFAESMLRTVALWVAPGLSWFGGLFAGIVTLLFLSRRYKVRAGRVFESAALALPVALIVGKLGSFLDGTEVGKLASASWAVRYVGQVGRRHPVQLYEIVFLLGLFFVAYSLKKRARQKGWPYGSVGIWFSILYSVGMFLLEFLKEGTLYWRSLSANQWALVVLFAESVGVLYVRGGGREVLNPLLRAVTQSVRQKGISLYAKISKQRSL